MRLIPGHILTPGSADGTTNIQVRLGATLTSVLEPLRIMGVAVKEISISAGMKKGQTYITMQMERQTS